MQDKQRRYNMAYITYRRAELINSLRWTDSAWRGRQWRGDKDSNWREVRFDIEHKRILLKKSRNSKFMAWRCWATKIRNLWIR